MRRAFPALVLAAVLGAPAFALAQASEGGGAPDQVVLSGDVIVPRGTVAGEIVVFHGSATVHGVASGDIVVLDGSIVVGGQVRGEVVALDGDVRLLPTAQIAGGVLAGGDVAAADGAQVAGTVRSGVRVSLAGPLAALGTLLAPAAIAVSTLVALLLLLLLAPRGLERVAQAARSATGASAGWGIVLTIALPAFAVLACASVLGLPLGLSLLLATGLVWFVGQACAAWAVGRALVREPKPRILAVLAGWAVAAAVGLVPLLNVGWWVLAGAFGVGTVTVASWRARGPGRHRAGGVPPPGFAPADA